MSSGKMYDDYDEISLREVLAYKLRFLPSARSLGIGAAVVATGFIIVNAAFLQPGAHPSAFFATRSGQPPEGHALRQDELAVPAGEPMTRIVFDDTADAAPGETAAADPKPAEVGSQGEAQPLPAVQERADAAAVQPDETLRDLQGLLAQLGFYQGALDGKSGPMTRQAIADYKASVGLQGIDLTVEQLARSATNNLPTTAGIPPVAPKPRPEPKADRIAAPSPAASEPRTVETVIFRAPGGETPQADPLQDVDPERRRIIAVQRALIRFTGQDMVVDGIVGSQTREAVRSFQNTFRMDVTGEIDETLIERMSAIGLLEG